MERIEDSPLLTKISEKLLELGEAVSELKVSITPNAEYFEGQNGDRRFVKWLDWQVYGKDSSLLYQSDLCVVHGGLEERVLAEDLKRFFSFANPSIDNEIYFED